MKRAAGAGNIRAMAQTEAEADPAESGLLRSLLLGTATETGEGFFRALVEHLARALGTYGAWVTEYLPEARRLRALAFRLGDDWVPGYEHDIDGTPCQVVLEERRLVHLA